MSGSSSSESFVKALRRFANLEEKVLDHVELELGVVEEWDVGGALDEFDVKYER